MAFSGCDHCGFVRSTVATRPNGAAGHCPECGRELRWMPRSDPKDALAARLAARRNRQFTALVAQQLHAARRGRLLDSQT